MAYAHFNCKYGFTPGAALAALIEAGADMKYINSRLSALKLMQGQLSSFTGRDENGLLYTGLHLPPTTGQHYPAVGLPEDIRARGLDAGTADKFSQVIGLLIDYYSAGIATPFYLSDRQIVELLGALLALESLQAKKLFVSPLPLGGVGGRRSEHLNVTKILSGFVVCPSSCQEAVITPLGAALIKCLAEPDRQMPEFTVQATGCGGEMIDDNFTGNKQGDCLASISFKALVNVVIGEPVLNSELKRKTYEKVLIMETAIDDMNPEFFPYLVARLLEVGALDAYMKPIIMKKGRPGVLLSVLAREDRQDALLQVIFSETSTLGVRLRTEQRTCLHREFVTVQTDYGAVQVKLALDEPGGQPLRYAPEFEDCQARARDRSVPVQNVYWAAMLATENMLKR